MAVRVEPPRGRPGSKEPANYPGLTPEERGADVAPTQLPPPEPPLWVIPSDLPQSSRSVGFVGALPQPIAPDPSEPDGLFDVPGLLERLWLARALEAAHHERPRPVAVAASDRPEPTERAAVPSEARSGGVAVSPPLTPSAATDTPSDDSGPRLAGAAPTTRDPTTGSVAAAWLRPRSWVCPYCYLTNDARATTCRGCRSGALHL